MERHFFMISRALNARKRKIFALFFALAASIGLSWAQNLSGSCGDDLTWEYDETTGELTISGTGTMLYDPSWMNEGLNSRITSVSLPEGLTDIGPYIFAQCEKLESITLPSGLTSIESSAFVNCRALREITLPGSLTTLGERAFNNCEKLESIILPEGITTLEEGVFSDCNRLQSVTLPTSLTSIGERAFNHCDRLASITLPDGLTSIGSNAFSGCQYLGSITLPEGVTSIGSSAFEHCGFESITLPEGITTLEYGVFSNCDRLQSVTLPPSLTSIGEWAFSGCWNLASVALPAGVTTIGESAFGYCTSLTEFTNNAATPQTINANVFEDVTLSNITLNVPGTSKAAYEAADVWKDFGTKAAIPGTEPAPAEPQRFTDTVKIEDLVVGDTLAMGAKMNSDQYFLFYCAPNRARRHGNLWTSDFESFFLGSADAISKHGAIDLENPDGLRGCLEPVNENGELAEEWIVTSTNPFTIAGIGKAEITNHSYNSDVDYAALEPGDTITFGATILNTPEKVWFLANRMQRIFSSGEISIIDDDRWSNSYGTIGKNGVLKADNYGTTQVPINEQGTLGGKWVVKFYSPLTIAGIGYPMPTLTLSDKVSIVGMPVAGIKDIGNDNYEVEPGTQFQIQAAVPEHYSLVGWSDLASTDPNYTANPRTITINSDSTIQPIYAIDTYTLTLGVNDESRGSVKIAPGMKKSVWDKEFLKNMYIWVQMMPSSAPHEEHNNNEKDNIRIEGQPMQTEVMWYYTTYFDPKGSSYIYMYEAGKAQFLFGFINGHHTFQRIEIYSTEGSNQYDGGWEYNTEKGCYQTTATEPFDMASLVLAEGQGVYLPVDSVIFYVPSELPEGVVPTETPGVYTVDYGTEIDFIATPASEEYYLAGWSNGAEVTGDTLTLTMTGELALTANFAHVPYTITLPEGVSIVAPVPAGITDKGNGVYEIVEGTEFRISVDSIPEHYHFGHWADLNSEDEQYAANPRTIVAGENLTVEPIFAIDTYIVTLASNDSTMGTLRVEGAGGSNIGPKEEINIYHGVVGEHYQVLGEYSGSSWIGVGGNDNKTITVESLNGEIIDNITLEVYMPSHWTGYSIASTSGTVSGDVANYQDLVITNINATSVTLSRVGEGENGGSVLFSEITVNGRDEQQGGQAEPITVTITNKDFPSEGNSFTKDGVTVSAETMSANYIADGTFSTTLGNITRIQVTSDARDASGDGWVGSGKTWVGNASSVPFSGYFSDMHDVIGIKFVITIEPTAAPAASGIVDNGDGTYTVDWGTEMSIIAEPAEGYMLASWNGEPALSDTLKQTVEGALSINATFKHIPAVITLPEGVSIVGMPIEGITSKGEGVYEVEYGTEFQISADSIPAHHHFDHWADLADSVAQYAANPRTIVAGENLTVEPIFAIDTYTLTLATNDSTKGVVAVKGAGSGAGASVGEMISLSEKQTENPVMGEYFQVAGEGVNYEGRIIGRSDDYQLTISSQNGEKLDFIILKVSSKGLWSGYTVSSTAGDVEDLLDNFTIRVSNINATSVTISRSGTTANPTGYIIVSNVYVNEEIPLSVDITDRDFPNSGNVLTGNGVTLTAGSFDLATPQIVGGGTFTTDLGNFTKIEIYAMRFSEFSGEGWTEEGDYARVWTGNASSVSFDGAVIGEDMESIYISYTIAPASAASGIVDNGDGTYTVDYGTELTFVAKPAEGFMLESWSNGAAVTGDTLKLTMTEELSLTANFKHIPATITLPEGVNIVEPMPAGITAKGEGVYEVEYGTEFRISADSIPAHYHFDHWADLADSAAMYAANPRTIVAGENLTVEPIFAIDTYTLTLATNDSTMGTLRIAGIGEEGGLQEPSAQLIVPESWSSEVGVTITAADLPGFVASTEEAVKALPVPTEGSVFVIYNFKDNGGVEAVTFENGEYVRTTSSPVDRANISYYSNQGMIFLYTTAAGQAGQGGEGEEPEGEPVSVTIGDLTTAQVSDYLPACTMTNYAYSQQIYMANEIGGAGKITAITYWLMNNSNYTRNYEIYMKEVSESAFASNDAWVLLAESDKVASYALANDTDEPVAKTITLNAPFEYSGNGNLMIAIRDITGQWSSGAKGLVNDVNGNKTLYSFRDSKAYDVADPAGTGLLYAKRNVVKIDMIAAPSTLPEGIVDNGDGTYTVDYGTELTFVAQPAEGFMLDSWSNGAEVTGDTLKLTMTEELSLTANFKYIPAVITLPEGVNIVEPVPAGITAKGEGVYEVEHGTEFQISADGAPEHYHFDHWADLDSTNTEYYANPRTVVADTNFTADPFYTIDTYTLTLASNDTTMGKLTIEPADGIVANGDGTYTVDWGTEVTFVAVPAEDYHLLSWSNGAAVTADNKQTLTITDQLSLSAFFKHDTYILTVEGAEVEVAKFADGTNDAAVLNPGTLVGVQAGDSVKLTTTATYSSTAIGDDLTITLHYAIEVIDGGIYDNEYALEIEEEEYSLKGAILEPMNPDKDASAEDPESEVEEGLEIQAYGYCHGSEYSIRYHLKSGNPNQYKVEFADARFTDVDWTDLEVTGKDGTIDIEIPVDLPTGDYSMTVTFRDSRYTWLESAPITVSFHVNLPETYVVALFDDVMAVVDTCECLTDIQWYWRANSTDQWQAIEGATGYYYKQAGGLSGEFFIHAKMNGIDTYTCPQEDLSLYADGKRAKVTAYPNPVQSTTTVTIENSLRYEHDMRIVNLMGNEVLNTTFEGNTTTVEMDAFPHGSYIISVDGVVVNVMKQ